MNIFKLYFVCLLVFCAIDFVWVGLIAKHWYAKELGDLLVDSVRWVPIIGFYMLYPAAILVFAVQPSINLGSWGHAAFYGGFLGLTCYAAYDLTNLATLKNWPVLLAICDMLWGTFVTSATSLVLFNLQRYFLK